MDAYRLSVFTHILFTILLMVVPELVTWLPGHM